MNRSTPIYCLLLLLLILTSLRLDAQSIGGTVNRYTSVVAIGDCGQVTVADTTGFAANDLIMIIQMQGARIDMADGSTYGDVQDTGSAGYFEFATISSIRENVFQLRNLLLHKYSPAGITQIVRVPQYNDVTISSRLTPMPWNGKTGGVVAIDASGTIRLDADIDATGSGFRGGSTGTNYRTQEITRYSGPDTTVECAIKGEGIVVEDRQHNACRGRRANGGGGGNACNSGGGGGGNGGSGGQGGHEWSGSAQYDNGGIGGSALQTGSGRLFLGGGGGGGQQNNNVGTAGARGGGIVFLRASRLDGNGHTISANALDADYALNDGGGGGGAGGSIALDVQTFTSALRVEANGGGGGSVNFPLSCHGPGGGGGGGVLRLAAPALPSPVTARLDGGASGINLGTNISCQDAAYGAIKGMPGVVMLGMKTPEGDQPTLLSGTRLDTMICPGDSVRLTATQDAIAYSWSPGDDIDCLTCKQVTVRPRQSTLYLVRIENSSGCATVDSMMVTVAPHTQLALGGDRTICFGDSVRLSATGGKDYHWEPAEGLSCVDCPSPMASPTHTITYRVTAPITSTCTSEGTVTVWVTQLAALFDTTAVICPGSSVGIGGEVSGGTPPYRYSWTPATGLDRTDAPSPVAHPETSTRYTMTAVDANGCRIERSVTVVIRYPAVQFAARLDGGQFTMGNTDLANVHCDSITLRNIGTEIVVIDNAQLAQNIQFSLPPSQIPLVIAPGDSVRLEICHQPRRLGEAYDTLTIAADCVNSLPLRAVGTFPGLSGSDRCGNHLSLVPADSSDVALKITNPYPNPADGGRSVMLEVESVRREHAAPFDCTLLDADGNVVRTGKYRGTDRSDEVGLIRRKGTYTITTEGLPNGMYFIAVETPEGAHVYPLVVGR